MRHLQERYRALHQGGEAAERAAEAIGKAARDRGQEVVVVSACLLGEPTRYDGAHKHTPAAVDPLLDDPGVVLLPLCPEILGGMGCPRPPVAFAEGDGDTLLEGRGRVVDDAGRDHTGALVRGAARAERLARQAGASRALLKERSPSCGASSVHGPAGVVPGRGAFAARLGRLRLPVVSEEDVLKR